MSRHSRGFTIVEMLVVIAIIALLVGVLMPAISNARNQAKIAVSESNLRQLGIAHNNYASEWNDRQFTLTRDDIASFGLLDNCTPGAVGSVQCLHDSMIDQGFEMGLAWPPPVILGWSGDPEYPVSRELQALVIRPDGDFKRNYSMLEPIAFSGAWGSSEFDKPRFGYFRLPNAQQFTRYLTSRFYDPVFYAPKDRMVTDMLRDTEDMPDEFTRLDVMQENYGWVNTDFCYSSYSLSPAALFSPDVMRHRDDDDPASNGWVSPWSLPAGFRAPSMSQARYANLKTHMLEHHWLQNDRAACNPAVTEARELPYKGCQPYFFNQSESSSPVTLFYDGHVNLVGVNDAQQADGRMQAQTGSGDWGLWSRNTPFGTDGYFIGRSYDNVNSSFHVLTTDGILGRDVIAASN
ncbi:MAG: type II secretion system protein [Planctomycetes bacterium]|nr:type II secretion system protein [Planctomycetota bacterium]